MPKSLRDLLSWLAAVSLSACATAPIELESMAASVLRMEVARVPAALAGQEVAILLDTGCDRVVVTEASLRRLGLQPEGGQASLIDITGTERRGLPTVELRDLRIGGMQLVPFRAIVLPSAAQGNVAWSIDLVAGMPVMANGAWLFDARRSLLRILQADVDVAELAELGYDVASVVSLSGGMRPRVDVTLNGQIDVTMLLDTGAGKTILPAEVARAMALPDGRALARERSAEALRNFKVTTDPPNIEVRVVAGDPGEMTGVFGRAVANSVHHLRMLELGSLEARDLVVQSHEDDGILGQDVLSRVPWLLNSSREQLWILSRR